MKKSHIVFDTSALLKILLPHESGASTVISFLQESDFFAASNLAKAEVESALFRRAQLGKADLAESNQARRYFEEQIVPRVRWVSMDGVLPSACGILRESGPLRILDSIHLATAKVANAPLFTFDRQLRKAAERAGVEVLPEAL